MAIGVDALGKIECMYVLKGQLQLSTCYLHVDMGAMRTRISEDIEENWDQFSSAPQSDDDDELASTTTMMAVIVLMTIVIIKH